jgi:hypothetical protein
MSGGKNRIRAAALDAYMNSICRRNTIQIAPIVSTFRVSIMESRRLKWQGRGHHVVNTGIVTSACPLAAGMVDLNDRGDDEAVRA